MSRPFSFTFFSIAFEPLSLSLLLFHSSFMLIGRSFEASLENNEVLKGIERE